MTHKKYKDILKKMKIKQNDLTKENNTLKSQINNINNIVNINNDNKLNNTMFNIQPQNNLNSNSFMYDNNRIQQRQNIFNNTLNIDNNQLNNTNLLKSDINNYFGMLSSFPNIDDDNDYKNKKTLDEFHQLLRKMDERLEAPIIENRTGNI